MTSKGNGYLQIDNAIVDELCRLSLTAYESRILWAILRKTYGWNKTSDKISYGQFTKMTGIQHSNVARTLKSLISRNVIIVDKAEYVTRYQLQEDFTLWKLYSGERLVSYESTLSDDTKTVLWDDKKQYSGERPTKYNTKTNKNTSRATTSFEEYKESLRERFAIIDFDGEIEKFNLYWQDGKRKLKNPKLALLNWMQRAVKYQAEHPDKPLAATPEPLSDTNNDLIEELNRR